MGGDNTCVHVYRKHESGIPILEEVIYYSSRLHAEAYVKQVNADNHEPYFAEIKK